jgi:uncharacterized membrane protein
MQPLLEIPIYVSPVFIATGLILWFKPPKKINSIYGYRTKRSMQSQEAWDYAQTESGKQLVYLGLAYLSTSVLGLIFEDISETPGVIISLGLMIIGVVLLFRRIENDLKQRFE